MTDKEIVCAIESDACIEKSVIGYAVRKRPEGRILGIGKDGAQAWRSARLNLFRESVDAILSEIPVVEI